MKIGFSMICYDKLLIGIKLTRERYFAACLRRTKFPPPAEGQIRYRWFSHTVVVYNARFLF